MKKKALSIVLAGTMALSMTAVSAVSVSAEELAPGGFGTLGEYTQADVRYARRLAERHNQG